MEAAQDAQSRDSSISGPLSNALQISLVITEAVKVGVVEMLNSSSWSNSGSHVAVSPDLLP
jgi:hypothetical protein